MALLTASVILEIVSVLWTLYFDVCFGSKQEKELNFSGSESAIICRQPTCTLSGGGVVNGTQNAANFGLWGMPTCTTLTSSGNSAFIGTMYTPETDMTFSGSADSDGAFVGKSMNITGGGNIHYDAARVGR
jgi:hypothetical protein